MIAPLSLSEAEQRVNSLNSDVADAVVVVSVLAPAAKVLEKVEELAVVVAISALIPYLIMCIINSGMTSVNSDGSKYTIEQSALSP